MGFISPTYDVAVVGEYIDEWNDSPGGFSLVS